MTSVAAKPPNHSWVDQWHGLLLINKPKDISSFGVIETLQRALRDVSGLKKSQLPAFGHGGTLDPFATGLLPVLVGRATRLSSYLLHSRKAYTATLHLGLRTPTADCTAAAIATAPLPDWASESQALAAIQKEMAFFTTGPYDQLPPMYSAKKVDGQRLYTLARQGKEALRTTVRCTIDSLQVTQLQLPDRFSFTSEVSAGTYIRTLGEDLAQRLGTLGALAELQRTRTGTFHLAQAIALDPLVQTILTARTPAALHGFFLQPGLAYWIPFDAILRDPHRLPIQLSEAQCQAFWTGHQAKITPILQALHGSLTQWTDKGFAPLYFQQKLAVVLRQSPNAAWEIGHCLP